MAHVDDGQLNALLDGELSSDAAREVTGHVATCPECARRLEEARAFLTEAGELLAVLTPPPRAATPAHAEPANARPVTPLVAKTAKEIAVSVDGRTEMTPAIRPVFKHEVPPAPRRSWKMPDLEKLAWAASLVLCLGVGYLANEVYHLRQQQTTADNARPAQTGGPTDVTAVQEPAAATARPSGHQPVRPSAGPSVRRSVSPPAEREPDVSASRDKPPVTKPAPAFARQQPEQIASNAPAPTVGAATQPTAQRNRGALGDVAGAPSPAPSAARDAAGAGARTEGRATNALDEATVTAPASVAARAAVPTTFRRVTMDEAVRHLSGSIRLIDGMSPARVEVGPGRLVPGADPDREVVRVSYASGTSRLVLDQQIGENQGASFNGLMPGDTMVTALGSNGTQVRWLDRKFWLSLTGEMAADSIRAIVERVR